MPAGKVIPFPPRLRAFELTENDPQVKLPSIIPEVPFTPAVLCPSHPLFDPLLSPYTPPTSPLVAVLLPPTPTVVPMKPPPALVVLVAPRTTSTPTI